MLEWPDLGDALAHVRIERARRRHGRVNGGKAEDALGDRRVTDGRCIPDRAGARRWRIHHQRDLPRRDQLQDGLPDLRAGTLGAQPGDLYHPVTGGTQRGRRASRGGEAIASAGEGRGQLRQAFLVAVGQRHERQRAAFARDRRSESRRQQRFGQRHVSVGMDADDLAGRLHARAQ